MALSGDPSLPGTRYGTRGGQKRARVNDSNEAKGPSLESKSVRTARDLRGHTSTAGFRFPRRRAYISCRSSEQTSPWRRARAFQYSLRRRARIREASRQLSRPRAKGHSVASASAVRTPYTYKRGRILINLEINRQAINQNYAFLKPLVRVARVCTVCREDDPIGLHSCHNRVWRVCTVCRVRVAELQAYNQPGGPERPTHPLEPVRALPPHTRRAVSAARPDLC